MNFSNSILGDVTAERVEIVRQADHIFISMIREANLYDRISQAYAALDTSQAVGVMVCMRSQTNMNTRINALYFSGRPASLRLYYSASRS